MVLPNDSHTAGTSGTVFATHTISGKEYPVGLAADANGHVLGSLPAYGFVIPPAAVGASKLYFDIFNAQAGKIMRLRKLFAVVATDVAVTGTLGVRLDAMRTSAVGTGGTALTTTKGNSSKTAASFYNYDPSGNAISTEAAGITGRVGATGGATDDAWLWPGYFFTEETNVSSQVTQFYDLVPHLEGGQPMEFPNGYGFKVVQGSVASVGTIGFFGTITVE